MNRPADLTSKTLSNAPKQDLRTWLAQLEAADELQVVRGADREEEIGGIVDFYQRNTDNKAVLFDDIPGYPSGYRAVANILTSTRRIKMTLGLAGRRHRHGPRRLLAEVHEGQQDHPAGAGADRAGDGERLSRRRHRPDQDPRAEVARARRRLLHRHRRHGDHAPSRHRLDQLRRLSRAGARQEDRLGDVLQGQARQHHPQPLQGARPEVPDRGGVRHAPGAVHGGGARNPLRQERIRRGRRPARRAGRDHSRAGHRACRFRPMPRSRSKAMSRSTT